MLLCSNVCFSCSICSSNLFSDTFVPSTLKVTTFDILAFNWISFGLTMLVLMTSDPTTFVQTNFVCFSNIYSTIHWSNIFLIIKFCSTSICSNIHWSNIFLFINFVLPAFVLTSLDQTIFVLTTYVLITYVPTIFVLSAFGFTTFVQLDFTFAT